MDNKYHVKVVKITPNNLEHNYTCYVHDHSNGDSTYKIQLGVGERKLLKENIPIEIPIAHDLTVRFEVKIHKKKV